MFLRALALAGLAVALVAGPATATGIHGRGPRAEAAVDRMLVFDDGSQRVQVLNQLCTDPARIRHCSAFPLPLRRAIEQTFDRPITWVDARRVRGPDFWVFAPVAFGNDTAAGSFAWWNPRNACRGGAGLQFTRSQGAWIPTQGTAWEGCPAS